MMMAQLRIESFHHGLRVDGMKEVKLTTPVSLEDVQELELGDVVYLNGLVFTCRGLFQKKIVEEGLSPPIDTHKINVMIHMGPIVKKSNEKFVIISMAPTTSNRYEKWGSKIIRKLGIRVIVGKGTMGSATVKAMKKFGCIHLTSIGILGPILPLLAKVREFHLYELGPLEAVWVLEVKDLGPFLVDIDTKGNSYFKKVNEIVKIKRGEIYKKLGILENFKYQSL
jgi:L(+)-tartrate dehydratase beta subunit